jgi:hypothetical protein
VLRKLASIFVVLAVAIVIAMQFFPPERANPPVNPASSFVAVAEPPQQVAAVIARACRDCHTNETVWPAYSRVWPVSWLVAKDVREGRAKLNFSEWRGVTPEMTELRMNRVCSEVRKGEMPPSYYRPLHSDARLASEDVQALCAWPAEKP